jgi:peroxiredoxin
MRHAKWFLIALVVALPEAARADAFKDLELFRPGRATVAGDFTVPGLTGQLLRLSDFRGRVVFLNFWATWCPPCKEEMPSMERLYRRYKDNSFTILALSIDSGDAGRVAGFVKKLGLTFPIGLDRKQDVANQYSVRGLPATFLIDRKGTIAAVAIGARDWDGKSAHAVIESLLR